MDTSDEGLWPSVLRGSDAAFAVVWDRHFGRVKARLWRLTEDEHRAEELAALALLEAWRQRRKARFVKGSLLPWLLVTGANLQKNDSRARARYAKVLKRSPAPLPAMDPADLLESRAIDPSLTRALGTLSADDLALLLLVALEGISVKDAAKAVGIQESAGRTRLSRLRRRLQADGDLRALNEGTL